MESPNNRGNRAPTRYLSIPSTLISILNTQLLNCLMSNSRTRNGLHLVELLPKGAPGKLLRLLRLLPKLVALIMLWKPEPVLLKSTLGQGVEQKLVIENTEEPEIWIESCTRSSRKGLRDLQSVWFGMVREMLSCWVSDRKRKSSSCFLASLSYQVSTPTSDSQVIIGK